MFTRMDSEKNSKKINSGSTEKIIRYFIKSRQHDKISNFLYGKLEEYKLMR